MLKTLLDRLFTTTPAAVTSSDANQEAKLNDDMQPATPKFPLAGLLPGLSGSYGATAVGVWNGTGGARISFVANPAGTVAASGLRLAPVGVVEPDNTHVPLQSLVAVDAISTAEGELWSGPGGNVPTGATTGTFETFALACKAVNASNNSSEVDISFVGGTPEQRAKAAALKAESEVMTRRRYTQETLRAAIEKHMGVAPADASLFIVDPTAGTQQMIVASGADATGLAAWVTGNPNWVWKLAGEQAGQIRTNMNLTESTGASATGFFS